MVMRNFSFNEGNAQFLASHQATLRCMSIHTCTYIYHKYLANIIDNKRYVYQFDYKDV